MLPFDLKTLEWVEHSNDNFSAKTDDGYWEIKIDATKNYKTVKVTAQYNPGNGYIFGYPAEDVSIKQLDYKIYEMAFRALRACDSYMDPDIKLYNKSQIEISKRELRQHLPSVTQYTRNTGDNEQN